MAASQWDIWRHVTNVIGRADYGVNGKKQFELQKERMENMAKGGNGGTPGNAIMVDVSGHEDSIRAMHFADWTDADFAEALQAIARWEKSGKLPPEPKRSIPGPVVAAIDRAFEALSGLGRDDIIDALNRLGERLGVMEGDDSEK